MLKNKNIVIIFRIISLLIIIGCLVVLYKWNQNNNKNANIKNELESYAKIDNNILNEYMENNILLDETSEKDYKLDVNFDELKSKNTDTVAWIKVNNTNINFPIVQSSDNNYYLKHNFYNESNGAGWIFADYKCNFDILSKNTIIYGHNRRNGTMFSNLSYMLEKNWNFENDNSYFEFATKSTTYKADLFSVYMIDATKLTLEVDFYDNYKFYDYIEKVKKLSIYDFGLEINENDKIITLCTCDNTSKNRIIVVAKLNELKQ